MVFVLSYISKPAFQGDSLTVVRTVGNAFSGVPVPFVLNVLYALEFFKLVFLPQVHGKEKMSVFVLIPCQF